MNPYWRTNFFQFFAVLFKRMTGQLPLENIPSDEIQLLTLLFISISTVLLGTFLTLRKMTMLANSLSHTTLLGIVIYLLFSIQKTSTLELNPFLLIVASILSAFLTLLFTEGVRYFFALQEDAAIGLVFTTFFALGVLLITLFTRSSHIGVDIITGNVDALSQGDLLYTGLAALINIIALFFSFRPWAISAFDPQFASSAGLGASRYHYLQMALTSLTLVVSIRAIGVLLVLAFLVGPALIARHWTHRLHTLLWAALGISVTFSLCGVALARHLLSVSHLAISTGGLIVTLLAVGYFGSGMLAFRKRSRRKALRI
jgi:manganese/zinc/iron transport system permease protein